MKLHSLRIDGFKRIHSSEVKFGDATFLIGSNNAGKSSVLKAIEWLLSDKKRLDPDCFYSEIDAETGENKVACKTVVLEAEFRNVPEEASRWRGFKGRVFGYDPGESGETGKCIFYRKTYGFGDDVVVEIKSFDRRIKPEFEGVVKPSQLLDAGLDAQLVLDVFPDPEKKIGAAEKSKLELIDALWDVEEASSWVKNPGGIAGVVLSRLPGYLFIPAESASHEIDDKKGVLQKTLNELFKDVRGESEHYKKAQECLNDLAKELNPADHDSEFGKMMGELNGVLSGVFPESRIYASANLSDPDTALIPAFDIEMSSNIRTAVSNQGTGVVRAAVFGLLRFRQQWLKRRGGQEDRSLIIAFEEPEIYLHPSAANQMRDLIYELSGDGAQIIATTHSPYLIDLSRKPKQVLNRFHYDKAHSSIVPFSVTDEFVKLQGNDKDCVKMILKMDDHASRVFFTKKVVVVEGDTEEVVFKEAIKRLPFDVRSRVVSNTELVKARGKAAIIGFLKYLRALDVDFFVVHDRDGGTPGAEVFNEPIRDAAGDAKRVIMLEECIEDLLDYPAPSAEKPFSAYKKTLAWGDDWGGVPQSLKDVLTKAYSPYI